MSITKPKGMEEKEGIFILDLESRRTVSPIVPNLLLLVGFRRGWQEGVQDPGSWDCQRQLSSERKFERAGVSTDLRDEQHSGGGGGQESY